MGPKHCFLKKLLRNIKTTSKKEVDNSIAYFRVIISVGHKDIINIRKPIDILLIKKVDFSINLFDKLFYTETPQLLIYLND